jgi:UDP-sugar transporter A1/2/3
LAAATASTSHFTQGVAPILLASFISGLAGALAQKNLQSASGDAKGGRNPYLFNMEMNSASALILAVSLLFSSDGARIKAAGFFEGWTPQTWIPIVTNAIGGIIVGLVTKHAGAVRKGFALIFGILISGLWEVQTVGITKEQIVGGVLAAISLWMHTSYPYKAKEKKEE